MKTIFSLILILTVQLFSQGWNNTVTTTVNEPNIVKMDLFTNKYGSHIIVQNSNSTNSIKYYLLNSSGSVVRSSTIETSGSAEFPNVSGDNDKVYLVYKLGSYLKAKKSTDAGQNWNNFNIPSQYIGSNTCNGVDIVYADNGVHVVYAMKDSDPNYETYYYKINSSGSWVDYKNVTDYDANEVGGFPSVAVSDNRVHVSYNTYPNSSPYGAQGTAKTRDKYQTNWQTPQTVLGSPNSSSSEFLAVRGSNLYDFYLKFWSGMGQFGNSLCVKDRTLSGTTWSSETQIEGSTEYSLFRKTITSNNNLNIVYSATSVGYVYKYYNGTSWSSATTVTSDNPRTYCSGFSSVSNDLFVSWYKSGDTYIKYRQYDAFPLAPQNLQISVSSGHPVLTWTANSEPDLSYYLVDRSEDGYNWDNGIAQVSTNSFTDNDVFYNPVFEDEVYYKVRAVDLGAHISNSSNTAYLNHVVIRKQNLSAADFDYRLNAAYPNPFNPTTIISYSIKEEGLVTIKVYDVLGNEAAELVNEVKPEGFYEVEFNSINLPSGIYFYRMQSGKFIATNKMILLR